MAVPNSTYDQVSAITNKFYMPKFPEAVFTGNPILNKFWKGGTKASSGTKLHQPIIYAAGTGSSFNPRAQLDIAANDQITAADFNWKHYYQAISIFDDELMQNKSPEGKRKLLDAKMKIAKMSILEDMATDMWLTSTSYSGDSDLGLNSIVGACGNAAYPTTTITYGGIQKSSTNTFWHGYVTNENGTLTVANMETSVLEISKYGSTPDLITCAFNQVENFYGLINAGSYERWTQPQQTGNMGFVAYSFKGIPIIPDEHVTSTEMYFLTTEYLDLVSHKDRNMKLEPFQKPVDQAAAVAKIYWMGNLACSDCRRQAVMYGITA